MDLTIIYKYILFFIISFAFVKYEFGIKNIIILQILLGCFIILFIIDYIITSGFSFKIPFYKQLFKTYKKHNKHNSNNDDDDENNYNDSNSGESLIDSDSMELINEKPSANVQVNYPPSINSPMNSSMHLPSLLNSNE